MAGGRPRTVSLEPDEMIKLGEEMLTWVKDNQPLHISHWYSIEMFIPDNTWDTMIKREEFVPYYEKALKIIGIQYLDKNSNVREGASQRWQRVYFRDLRKQEDEDLVFKSNLDKEGEKKDLAVIEAKIDSMTSQIQQARAAKQD